jgi:predicted nucleic acid-binding protein
LWRMGVQVVPRIRVSAVADDPDDDRILECALTARASVIVSGDRHLLSLGSYESIAVLSPREFMDIYVGKR